MKLKGKCQHCSCEFEYETAMVGQTIDCPNCRRPLYLRTSKTPTLAVVMETPHGQSQPEREQFLMEARRDTFYPRIRQLVDNVWTIGLITSAFVPVIMALYVFTDFFGAVPFSMMPLWLRVGMILLTVLSGSLSLFSTFVVCHFLRLMVDVADHLAEERFQNWKATNSKNG